MVALVYTFIIATKGTNATKVSYNAAENLYNFLKKHKHPVRMITDPFAEKGVFETLSLFFPPGPRLICYFGHGRPTKMCGSLWASRRCKGEGVIDLNSLPYLKDSVVYSCACYTGSRLGLISEKEALSYFGWTAPVNVFYPKQDHNYMKDWIDIMTVFPKLVANCTPVDEAFKLFKDLSNTYMEHYQRNAITLGEPVTPQLKAGKMPNADYYYARCQSNTRSAILLGNTHFQFEG